jgi:hypothetical protein
MQQQTTFQKFLPHIAAFLIFMAVTVGYFSPVIMGGKKIAQSDVTNFLGGAKEIIDHREKYNEEPLWTNGMFSGMPAYQISTYYPANQLSFVRKVLTFGLPHPTYAIVLAMLCFYLLMLVLNVNPWIGIFGSLGFGLTSFLFVVIEAGHNPQAIAIAYMPGVLAGFVLAYRGKILLGAALTALLLGLQIFANHLQMTYYLMMILGIYVIAEMITAVLKKELKKYIITSGALLAGVLLAVGANFSNIMATYDYGKYTTRGKSELTINADGNSNKSDVTSGLDRSYATAWSYGIDETFTLLIPNYKGGASEPIGVNHKDAVEAVSDPQMRDYISKSASAYFGDQPFTSGPVYVGAALVFLFVLALMLFEGPLKWSMLIVSAIAVMLAWGNNFMSFSNFFFDNVPGYNKFRSVSFILVIVELTVPLLAALMLDKIVKNPDIFKEKFMDSSFSKMRVMIVAFALTGGFCLLCYLSPTMFNTLISDEENVALTKQMTEQPKYSDQIAAYMDALTTARTAIVKSDSVRSFFFITIVALAIYFFTQKKISSTILFSIIIPLLVFDLWTVDRRYLNNDNFENKPRTKNENPFAKEGRPWLADQQILEDKSPSYRVFNLLKRPDQDAGTSYFHKSLGGYHGAKLKRYQELVDFHIGQNFMMLNNVLKQKATDSLVNGLLARMHVLNMLNTKYLIYNPEAPPIVNRNAYGNAWFVNNCKFVTNADSEITALDVTELRYTAVVNNKYKEMASGNFKSDSSATIKMTQYKANHLIYESNTASEQLAVFSEIYFPTGWNAYIDGKLTDHFNANFVLRAMKVPAGKHTVEFKFEPDVYYKSEKISLASSILLLLGVAGAGFLEWKKNKAKTS